MGWVAFLMVVMALGALGGGIWWELRRLNGMLAYRLAPPAAAPAPVQQVASAAPVQQAVAAGMPTPADLWSAEFAGEQWDARRP